MWKALLIFISYTTETMANTCPTTYASACGAAPLQHGLNSSDKEAILAAHNKVRNEVALGQETRGSPGPQPSASNMRLLTWNDELASLAQSWANQCNFSHNHCGGSSSFSVGQNIYAVIATKLISFNMTQPLWSWFNEVQFFNKSSISPFAYLEKAGHYTELAWAKTYNLGCGYIAYTNSSTGNVWHTMVCNYGPAGNYAGGTMYNTTGKPCAACSSCSAEYEGLCAA